MIGFQRQRPWRQLGLMSFQPRAGQLPPSIARTQHSTSLGLYPCPRLAAEVEHVEVLPAKVEPRRRVLAVDEVAVVGGVN